jgi:hypothetical protein
VNSAAKYERLQALLEKMEMEIEVARLAHRCADLDWLQNTLDTLSFLVADAVRVAAQPTQLELPWPLEDCGR